MQCWVCNFPKICSQTNFICYCRIVYFINFDCKIPFILTAFYCKLFFFANLLNIRIVSNIVIQYYWIGAILFFNRNFWSIFPSCDKEYE